MNKINPHLASIGALAKLRKLFRKHERFSTQSLEEKQIMLTRARAKRDKRNARNLIAWTRQQEHYYFIRR